MKIKTSELTGAALDWAVAKCEGYLDDCNSWLHDATLQEVEDGSYKPSVNWSQGGPIIEREKIVLTPAASKSGDGPWVLDCWQAQTLQDHLNNEDADNTWHDGETYLIAAMRCLVASRLGGEVEVPDELI